MLTKSDHIYVLYIFIRSQNLWRDLNSNIKDIKIPRSLRGIKSVKTYNFFIVG
jgi:hypothetical protein